MSDMTIRVSTFEMGTSKEAAVKVLEEAAEAFGAWQEYDAEEWYAFGMSEPGPDIRLNAEPGICDALDASLDCLADELADVMQAACNLAARHDIDMDEAMRRCEARNRKRGRYE